MTDYTITTDFGAKDSLPSGNAAKVIKGSEFTTEFTNIKTAVNSKADTAGDTFTGAVTFDAAVTLNADVTFDTNTMFVDVSENRVGIGTTSPLHKVDIMGDESTAYDATSDSGQSNHDATLQIFNKNATDESFASLVFRNRNSNVGISRISSISKGSGTTDMSFVTENSNVKSEKLRIKADGNVGIGTTSPANTLTVGNLEASEINQDATVGIKCNTNHKGLILQENSGAEQWSMGINANGDLNFYDSAVTDPLVTFQDNSGNVGIGTTAPSSLLHLKSSSAPTLKIDDSDSTYALELAQNDVNASVLLKSAGQLTIGVDHDNVASVVAFQTRSDERMRIDASGNVGIGTINPTHELTVGDANAETTIGVAGNRGQFGFKSDLAVVQGGSGKGIQFNVNNNTFGSGEAMRIDSSGNLLVGTTNANLYDDTAGSGIALHANGRLDLLRGSAANAIFNRLGTDGEQVIFRKDGTTVGSISVTASATAYNTSSDERLKENIQDAEDAGSKIDAIQIRQFDWKSDGSHQDYGVIAQELLEVAPEAVSEGETEEDMMGVDYSKLVPMLIKEVQTLRNRVAQLENN